MTEHPSNNGEANFSSKEVASELQTTSDAADERIEELIDAKLSEDPNYANLDQQRLASLAKGDKVGEAGAVKQIRALREQARAEINHEPAPSMEPRNRERLLRWRNTLNHLTGDETDRDILWRLGMVDVDGHFKYPTELFAPMTDEAWEQYEVIVKEHNVVIENAQELGTPNEELEAIDKIRVRRHNEFSRLLMQDLGLDDTEDNFYIARQLAVKMREARFPNTGELKIAASLAIRMLDSVRDRAA